MGKNGRSRRERLEIIGPKGSSNSLNDWWRLRNPFLVICNFLVIELCKYLPSLALKRVFLRLTGMRIGKRVAPAFGGQFDFFYPDRISIGENSMLGYNSTILCHEFLIKELRVGNVKIGRNVMIGANTTILPGVIIGDGAVVSACSLVNRDVKAGSFVGGVPIKEIRRRNR